MSLFDEKGWMRESPKSELYTIFTPTIDSQRLLSECQFVIDGGWLLWQITWLHGITYSQILELYRLYIVHHFRSDAVVIFDGYKSDIIGTKSYERLRRKEKFLAADVEIGLNKMITTTKDKFLMNVVNKFKLVNMLSDHLNEQGIKTEVAKEDADALIVDSGIKMQMSRQATDKPIVVVGNDVDLLVLLVGMTPEEKSLYFYKITPTGKNRKVLYSTWDHKHLKPLILFAHAFAGCDSTSALFGNGKKSIITLLQKHQNISDSTSIFYTPNCTAQELYPVAEKIVKHLYIKDDRTNLPINALRYQMFTSAVMTAKKDLLSYLPPTQAALLQHVKRVYFQIQQWLCQKLDPLQWGWEPIKMLNIVLTPIKTSEKAAPEELLAMVSYIIFHVLSLIVRLTVF